MKSQYQLIRIKSGYLNDKVFLINSNSHRVKYQNGMRCPIIDGRFKYSKTGKRMKTFKWYK